MPAFEHVTHAIRAARITARDERIPKPLRRLAAVGLLPIPGLLDEAVLLLMTVVLAVGHRDPLRTAWRSSARPPG